MLSEWQIENELDRRSVALGAAVPVCSSELPQSTRAHDREYFKKKQESCGYCGRFSLRGSNANQHKFVRLGCKTWACKHCGPKRASTYKRTIRENAERLGLRRFLTLTLDPKKIGTEENAAVFAAHLGKTRCLCDVCEKQRALSVVHLRESFNKLRTYWKRKFREAVTYIAVLEFQKNGMGHLHLMVDRYMSVEWVRSAWEAVGGGWMVNIQRFVDVHRISHYLSKYLTKDLLLSAPKRARRVTCSRGIKLNGKAEVFGPKQFPVWEMLTSNIDQLAEAYAGSAAELQFSNEVEGESFLQSFVIEIGRF